MDCTCNLPHYGVIAAAAATATAAEPAVSAEFDHRMRMGFPGRGPALDLARRGDLTQGRAQCCTHARTHARTHAHMDTYTLAPPLFPHSPFFIHVAAVPFTQLHGDRCPLCAVGGRGRGGSCWVESRRVYKSIPAPNKRQASASSIRPLPGIPAWPSA